jgi:hypothetical protein
LGSPWGGIPAGKSSLPHFKVGMPLAYGLQNQTLMRTAWLIGVYTIETECRIEELGYTISNVYATIEAIDSCFHPPDIIVFSEDGVNSLDDMELARQVFPETLIISVMASHVFLDNCQSYSERRSSEQSLARLLFEINAREHRWDN